MRQWFALAGLALALGLFTTWTDAGEKGEKAGPNDNKPPKGFTALFNGKDLTGWQGLIQINNRKKYETKEAYAAAVKAATEKAFQHWTVKDGVIHYDGKNNNLQSAKDYGNFELYVDWLMVSHNGDSGIYLRSYPQVQIWDPDNPREVRNGAPKGSGALWNDNDDNPGKWPIVKADNPVGQWNTLRIKMIGSRVWVWLNEKQTVDGQMLDNYFDRKLPLVPKGAIELQTHGSEIRFRNIYVREISPAEAKAALDKLNR